jgi:hypothetical protein
VSRKSLLSTTVFVEVLSKMFIFEEAQGVTWFLDFVHRPEF